MHLNVGAEATPALVLRVRADAAVLYNIKGFPITDSVRQMEHKRKGKRKANGISGYEEATEQESSSSRRFLLSGCSGFLDTKGEISCKVDQKLSSSAMDRHNIWILA